MGHPAKLVIAVVDRDINKIPCTVFEHELPILEAAHGEGSVVVQGPALDAKGKPIKGEIEGAQEEWDRLNRLYVRRNANPLLRAYPGGIRQFQQAIGVEAADTGEPEAGDA